jgi:hypothetical protein
MHYGPNCFCGRDAFIRSKPMRLFGAGVVVIHDNLANRMPFGGDISFKFLPYQLRMVGYWPTMALTGNGELGFDSGEGA